MNRSRKWNRSALVLALVTLAILAIGCGGQERGRTSTSTGRGQDAVAASAGVPAIAPVVASEGPAPSTSGMIAAITRDSVPPDVSASVISTLVTPGTVIEVTAQGSPDVEEVLLSDGIGNPQHFAYDEASGLWRASYRVPIRFPAERLGLAVTAKNDLERWRRVWVFLGVQQETPKDSVRVEEK